MKAKDVQLHLRSLSDDDLAKKSQRFFKTGKGEYGEREKFLGIRVPALRAETKRHTNMPLGQVRTLLKFC